MIETETLYNLSVEDAHKLVKLHMDKVMATFADSPDKYEDGADIILVGIAVDTVIKHFCEDRVEREEAYNRIEQRMDELIELRAAGEL
jgi:protein-L-isoaspartate O-methyltransferase